ncbi:MAG: DUF4214 domain-containing protein [Beijerinckiaceae bacterium]
MTDYIIGTSGGTEAVSGGSVVTTVGSNSNISTVALNDGTTISAVIENGSNIAHAGDLITITMKSLATMTVSGQPALLLNDNQAATYVSGSGTNALTFAYRVQPGDYTADLKVLGIGGTNGASVTYPEGSYLSLINPASYPPVATPLSINTHDLGVQVYTGATSVQQEVMGLYAALYGRAAESSGFSYWVGLVGQQPDAAGLTAANAGTTHITLADAAMLGQNFVNSQSAFFDATYGKMTDSQFVNAMYQNIGGNAGDPGGVAYWSNLLADAEAHGQSAQAARAGIAGQFVEALIGFDTTTIPAGLTNQQWSDALTRTAAINNKIAVSTAYANACAQSGGDILIPHAVNDTAYQAAVAILQSVTADPNTVAVAIAGINNAVAHHDLSLI